MRILPLALFLFAAFPAAAQNVENRVWVIWEQRSVNPHLCQKKGQCAPISTYVTRLWDRIPEGVAEELSGTLTRLASALGKPVDRPDAPRIAQHTDTAAALGFDAEAWEERPKADALSGLKGIYFNVEKMKAPPNSQGRFGEELQQKLKARFWRAGIPVLNYPQWQRTPGKPRLDIYLKPSDPQRGTAFSLFASVTQTVLLTRAHTTKLRLGTWGRSAAYDPERPERDEEAAILETVDAFITAFQAANPTEPASDG